MKGFIPPIEQDKKMLANFIAKASNNTRSTIYRDMVITNDMLPNLTNAQLRNLICDSRIYNDNKSLKKEEIYLFTSIYLRSKFNTNLSSFYIQKAGDIQIPSNIVLNRYYVDYRQSDLYIRDNIEYYGDLNSFLISDFKLSTFIKYLFELFYDKSSKKLKEIINDELFYYFGEQVFNLDNFSVDLLREIYTVERQEDENK